MAGIKGRSGRPGGNPDISVHGFKPKGDEALNIKVQFRVSQSQKAKLDATENWRETLRGWIDSLSLPEPKN